ncbi:hypothetical protein M9H77_26175 [Catharanthus roseus]|uniref:Uncharacterized protein n=1 Tax=Catharanthus roseus TaxID=4058 RepID=A0ACC0AAB1_CATRO|nr:hypothetical protein M9H77_26175 [Catharanthus roseus]
MKRSLIAICFLLVLHMKASCDDRKDEFKDGEIPMEIGNLPLELLILENFGLGELRRLWMGYNPLIGTLPIYVGNLSSSLEDVFAAYSRTKGFIPNEIANV